MRKMLLVVVVLVGAALLLAQPQARAGNPCTVPKSWGRMAGISGGSYGMQIFAFEAEDGTVRTVPGSCKSPASAIDTIHRSAD